MRRADRAGAGDITLRRLGIGRPKGAVLPKSGGIEHEDVRRGDSCPQAGSRHTKKGPENPRRPLNGPPAAGRLWILGPQKWLTLRESAAIITFFESSSGGRRLWKRSDGV